MEGFADRIAVMEAGQIQTVGEKHTVFSSPETRTAAALTGCKNISRIDYLDTRQYYALDWGIALTLPPLPEEATAIGIHSQDLLPGPGENSFWFRVVEEIENPASYTVALIPEGQPDAHPLYWTAGKPLWQRLRSDRILLRLPSSSILYLK